MDLSDCKRGMTDQAVVALARSNPDLHYIALDECELVTGRGLKEVWTALHCTAVVFCQL